MDVALGLTGAEEDARVREARAEAETGGDLMSAKAKKPEQPEQIPLMCAFDKTRPCDATCTAFYIIQSANGTTWGCKRMG